MEGTITHCRVGFADQFRNTCPEQNQSSQFESFSQYGYIVKPGQLPLKFTIFFLHARLLQVIKFIFVHKSVKRCCYAGYNRKRNFTKVFITLSHSVY